MDTLSNYNDNYNDFLVGECRSIYYAPAMKFDLNVFLSSVPEQSCLDLLFRSKPS